VKIVKGEYQNLIGKWAIDRMYEKDNEDLPPWACGDPWMTREFICSASYWFSYGVLCASLGVVTGHLIKKIMRRHGGSLNIARLKSEPGSINDVVLIGDKVCNAFVLRERPEDDLIVRLEIIDDSPGWFDWIGGQQRLF